MGQRRESTQGLKSEHICVVVNDRCLVNWLENSPGELAGELELERRLKGKVEGGKMAQRGLQKSLMSQR